MQKNKILSPIIAGTMSWGKWGKKLNESEQAYRITQCHDFGITSFDLADIYGDYTTEAEFGNAFRSSGLARKKIQLITKCGIQLMGTSRENPIKYYDYSKDYIKAAVEQSLKNLHTDYLDYFLLHRPSPLLQPEEVAAAIEPLMCAGTIQNFGVSNFKPSEISLLETCLPVTVNQLQFSLDMPKAIYNGTLNDCFANKRKVMAWSPLGYLYIKPGAPSSERIKKVLARLSEKYAMDTDQLLLAWLLRHPSKVHPIVGTTNLERLQKSAQSVNCEMDRIDWFALLEASEGRQVP